MSEPDIDVPEQRVAANEADKVSVTAAGAAAGTVLGSIVEPGIGSVVGTVVGTIVGAAVGRLAAMRQRDV